MDIYGLVLVFLGIIALCMGTYELYKKTVVGRNTSASTPEQIRRFSKVDGICYLVEAAVALLLAFSGQIPFLASDGAKLALAVIFLGTMIVNFVLAKKMLNNFPDEKKKSDRSR